MDGFIGTVVQVMVMFIAQITGALLIDKVLLILFLTHKDM